MTWDAFVKELLTTLSILLPLVVVVGMIALMKLAHKLMDDDR